MKRRRSPKRKDTPSQDRPTDWPGWVPVATRNYLAHVEDGQTIRALAKEAEVHPSTMLRRLRRVEALRDDPLLDAALRRIMGDEPPAPPPDVPGTDAIEREAIPVLRQMADARTILAIARDMDKGMVAREDPNGEPRRLAVVDRALAEEMAVRGWIAGLSAPESRIQRYRIGAKGRALLRGGAGGAPRRAGFAEAQAAFAMPASDPAEDDDRLSHIRSTLTDTPLMALARRPDERGEPFLSREAIAAGDRLREDFELARREEEEADWEAFLAGLAAAPAVPPRPRGVLPAGERLRRALQDLGPGMADVALRCCCLLEGLESVERRLGWSARSGKIVLRIALSRLQQHYRGEDARTNPLIG